jgi:hypothetical protein
VRISPNTQGTVPLAVLLAGALVVAASPAEAGHRAPKGRADTSRSRAGHSDHHPREQAPEQAREQAPEQAPEIDVEEIGAHAAAATDAMRARVREHVARQLRVLVDGRLLTAARGYVVDGSIDTLELVERPDGLELACTVRLILSARRSGAMVAMATGQATLKNGRHPLEAGQQGHLELEVLDGAVRAASDELVQHFESHRKS